MSVRKTGVLNVSSRRLLAMMPFMLLFSGCYIGIGEDAPTDQIRLEFSTIERVSIECSLGPKPYSD